MLPPFHHPRRRLGGLLRRQRRPRRPDPDHVPPLQRLPRTPHTGPTPRRNDRPRRRRHGDGARGSALPSMLRAPSVRRSNRDKRNTTDRSDRSTALGPPPRSVDDPHRRLY